MAIQMRRGSYANFNGGSNLVDGEIGVVTSGDPNTADGEALYIDGGSSVHRVLMDNEADVLLKGSSLPTDTASGAVASFSDGADDVPLISLVANVEPVQDLHGYDAPWPAGGGKNLFDTASFTVENDVMTQSGQNFYPGLYSTQDSIIANVTGGFNINRTTDAALFLLIGEVKEGEAVTLSFDVDSPKNDVMDIDIRTTSPQDTVSNNSRFYRYIVPTGVTRVEHTMTPEQDGYLYIEMYRSGVSRPVASTLSNIQLEKGSAATAWSPYANICPISGWTGAEVTAVGKNLFNSDEFQYGYWLSGTWHTNNTWGGVIVPVNEGETIYISGNKSESGVNCAWLTSRTDPSQGLSGYTAVGTSDINNTALTAPAGAVAFWMAQKGSTDMSELQIEYGATATAYAPYNGETITHEFKDELGNTLTVYGGEDELIRGKLRVTRKKAALLAIWNWQRSGSYPGGFYVPLQAALGYKTNTPFICSHAKTANTISEYVAGTCYCDQSLNFRLMPTDGSATVQDWKDFITAQAEAGTPIEICYELATPLEYDLTAEDIRTLYGDNTIYADCGDVEVTYRADIQKYIEEFTRPTEDDMIANANITSGKYFMVGPALFKATASIANGAAIVPGTNCTRVSIADALNALS